MQIVGDPVVMPGLFTQSLLSLRSAQPAETDNAIAIATGQVLLISQR